MFDIHTTTAPAFTVAVEGDDFRFSDLNAAFWRVSEARTDSQLGKRPHDYFPAPLADALVANYRRCVATRLIVTYELESMLARGYVCWRTTLVPVLDPATDAVTRLVGVCFDATAEKIGERAQSAFHENLNLAMGAIEGGFWTLDVATGAFEASRPLTNLLAGPDHPLLDLAEYLNFIYADDLGTFPDLTQDSTMQFRVVTHDGRTRWLHSKRRAIRDEAGTVLRIVALVLDVTDDTMRQRRLEDEAMTDELTGVRNRRGFERTAAGLFGSPSQADRPHALILVDLDRFKPVNDVHGHLAGDELLKEAARRIARIVRSRDCVARIGGDEFAMFVHADTLTRVLGRLERAFEQPFQLQQTTLSVGASFGTTYRREGDRCLADMMERADAALYAVKNQRRLLTA